MTELRAFGIPDPQHLPSFLSRSVLVTIAVISFSWAIAAAGDAVITGRAQSEPKWAFEARGGALVIQPDARVREFDLRGSYLDLDDLPGLPNPGWAARVRVSRSFGAWRVGVGAAFSRAAGDGNSTGGFAFNGGVFPPDHAVKSSVATTRIVIDLSRRLSGQTSRFEVRALAGLEHYHPIVTITPHPPIPLHDSQEDFLQFLPLPMLGIEMTRRVSADWSLGMRAWAGTARNWNTHRVEGGPMRMSLTLVDSEFRASRRVTSSLHVEMGYTFRFAQGTLESGEDGDWIRSREHELEAGVVLLR